MDAATVGPIHLAIHFPIFFRNMLEVAPQSLTPRTGKSTLSKRFKKYGFAGLPLILLWQASIIPFSTQAWAEDFKLYRPPATARVEGVSSRVSTYASREETCQGC